MLTVADRRYWRTPSDIGAWSTSKDNPASGPRLANRAAAGSGKPTCCATRTYPRLLDRLAAPMHRLHRRLRHMNEQQRRTAELEHGMVERRRRLDGIAPEIGQGVGHLGHGRLIDSFELAAVGPRARHRAKRWGR